jgi:hypothetical protein
MSPRLVIRRAGNWPLLCRFPAKLPAPLTSSYQRQAANSSDRRWYETLQFLDVFQKLGGYQRVLANSSE